jgi:hypothetical protein
MGMGGCEGLGFNPGRPSSSSWPNSSGCCSTSRAVWSWQSCFTLVVAVIMTTQTSGVVGTTHSAGSLTPAELVRANSAGAVHTAVDSTSIVSRTTSFGIAFAFGKLYVAPGGPTRSVIVLDPITNATASLANVAAVANSYFGFAFAAVTSKLYACPYNAPAVLVVDPLTNATDVATLANLSTGSGKWSGFAFAPNTGALAWLGASALSWLSLGNRQPNSSGTPAVLASTLPAPHCMPCPGVNLNRMSAPFAGSHLHALLASAPWGRLPSGTGCLTLAPISRCTPASPCMQASSTLRPREPPAF